MTNKKAPPTPLNPSQRLQNWRKNAAREYVLPSGNTALIKRVGIIDLAQQGAIPDTLSGMVSELAAMDDPAKLKLDLTDMKRFGEAIDLIALACFVDPPLTQEGDDFHLGVAEVPSIDKLAVFAWANDPAAQLQLFRPGESNGDVYVAPDGAEIRPETVINPGG